MVKLAVIAVLFLALAAPAAALSPTAMQKEIVALQTQNRLLKSQISSLVTVTEQLQKQQQAEDDRVVCFYAVGQDDINSVWHTLNLLVQYLGFPPQPDYPRYDDGGACSRIGVTRIR